MTVIAINAWQGDINKHESYLRHDFKQHKIDQTAFERQLASLSQVK